MHLDLPTYFGNKGNHASLNQLLGQVRVNAGLLSGARFSVGIQKMMVMVKVVTCEIKISLGLPASIPTLQSSPTSSQSDFSKMHTPGLLGPSELPIAP